MPSPTPNSEEPLIHLLALGAFWHATDKFRNTLSFGLNAPFGARCFLAIERIITNDTEF